MNYSIVDPILECWAKTHGLIIHKIFKDVEVRSIDMVGYQGKHFQIWIDECYRQCKTDPLTAK